nr:MAG TPA: hypothetical protein [Caudoviricetes sp.]
MFYLTITFYFQPTHFLIDTWRDKLIFMISNTFS